MAISKVILNGVTQMDVTQDTVAAGVLHSGYQATGADGVKIQGAYSVPTDGDNLAYGSGPTANIVGIGEVGSMVI